MSNRTIVPYRVVAGDGACRNVGALMDLGCAGTPTISGWIDGTTTGVTPPTVPAGGVLEIGECCGGPAVSSGNNGLLSAESTVDLVGAVSAAADRWTTPVTFAVTNPSASRTMKVVVSGVLAASEDNSTDAPAVSWGVWGEVSTGPLVDATWQELPDSLYVRMQRAWLYVPWHYAVTVAPFETVAVNIRARYRLDYARTFAAGGFARAAIGARALSTVYV